jgi:hypothetical protein
MKHFKFLFALVIAWMVGAVSIWAEKVQVEVDGITWTLNYYSNYNNPYCNVGLGGSAAIQTPANPTELVIPASFTINETDCPVRNIAYEAFKGIGNITKVTISEGIREIGSRAFQNCSDLTEVVIPPTVTEIGNSAFMGCAQLTQVSMPEKMVGELIFDESAFQNCTSLSTLYIGAGQQNGGEHTVIQQAVFKGCSNLQEVHIAVENPGRLYVREDAFEGIAQNCKFYVSQAFARAVEWGLTRTPKMTGTRKWGLSGLQTTDLVVEETAVGGKTLVKMPVKDDNGDEVGSYIAVVTFTSIGADNPTAVIYDGGIEFDADKIMTKGFTTFCGGNYSVHNSWYQWTGDGMNEGTGKMYLPETVKDKNDIDFQIKGLGHSAFRDCNNFSPKITSLRIPRSYEYIAGEAFQALEALKGTFIIPSSIHILGSQIFPYQRYNNYDKKINNVYLLHTNPDELTWGGIYTGWELSADVNLYIDNSIYYKIHNNGYDEESPFVQWEGQVIPYDASHYGLEFTKDMCLVDRTGALDNVELENPLEIAPLSWVNSTNTNVVSVSNGDLVIGEGEGTAEVTLSFAGNDDFDALDLTTTIIKRNSPNYTASQDIDNGLATLSSLTRLTPDIYEWEDSEEDYWSRHVNYNQGVDPQPQLYFSASNENGVDGSYVLDTNPAVLSPTYGTLAEGTEPSIGFNAGGLLCVKVSGAGTLQVSGFTESSDAVVGIWAPGQDVKELSGDFNMGESYEVTSSGYVYIYGISLSELRPAYINSIVWAPDGVELTNLTIAGVPVDEDTPYDKNGVTVTWQQAESMGEDPIGGEPGGGEGPVVGNSSTLVPVITLSNATITYSDGPAIEINSYPQAFIYLVGENTINCTAEDGAAISIGTMSGIPWTGCGSVFIGTDDNHDTGSLTITNGTNRGIYNYNSFIKLDDFIGDITGLQYGIHVDGEGMPYPDSYYVKLGAGLELKLRGGEAAFKSEILNEWQVVNDNKYIEDFDPVGDYIRYNEEKGSYGIGDGDDFVPSIYLHFAPEYFTAKTEEEVKMKFQVINDEQGVRTVEVVGIQNNDEMEWGITPCIPSDYVGAVTIPETVTYKGKEYTVTEVGEYSFYGCGGITTVTIPSTVTSMSYNVFTNCNLEYLICLATTPPEIDYLDAQCDLYVPYGCKNRYLIAYEDYWPQDYNIKTLAKGATTVTTITPEDEFATDFVTDMVDDEKALDLADAVACGVYYNLDENKNNGYDTEEECLVINSTTSEDDMEGIVSGATEHDNMVNQFSGLMMEVDGKGAVEIDCQTLGAGLLTVRVGNGDPETYTQSEKGTITVMFDVAMPTTIYVYAGKAASSVRSSGMRRVLVGDNSVKIYQLRVVLPEDITIKMNSLGIMTYASKYNLDFSNVEGLTAYFATEYDSETQKLTMEPQGVVNARSGMMLKGEPNKEYTIHLASSTSTSDDNLLVGLIEVTNVAQTQRIYGEEYTTFILANGQDGINWYKLAEPSYNLKANSAYLQLLSSEAPTANTSSNKVTMDFNSDEDGIDATTYVTRKTGNWYTIDGRKLQNKPATKGIYVNNGHKVVIK